MNRDALKQIEQTVTVALRKRREGVRGQGRLDVILVEALELIDSPLYRAVLETEHGVPDPKRQSASPM